MKKFKKSHHVTHQNQILAALFSPSFPIGAFAYSHGLEAAIAAGLVIDPDTAEKWIKTCLMSGSGRNDAIIFAHAWRAEPEEREKLNDLAFALCASAEREQEMRELGTNFRDIAARVYHISVNEERSMAYTVMAGVATRQLNCELLLSLVFFLQSFANNLISVVVRTVPLGQSEGQKILYRLMPWIEQLASNAVNASLDQIGGHAFYADHMAIKHETMETRIYRT
jgi:urease accessory protein